MIQHDTQAHASFVSDPSACHTAKKLSSDRSNDEDDEDGEDGDGGVHTRQQQTHKSRDTQPTNNRKYIGLRSSSCGVTLRQGKATLAITYEYTPVLNHEKVQSPLVCPVLCRAMG